MDSTMAVMMAHLTADCSVLLMDFYWDLTTAEQIPKETNLVETMAEMRALCSAQMRAASIQRESN